MATSTMYVKFSNLQHFCNIWTSLYLGFSFSDEYLNEFRSEVLSMLRPRQLPPQVSAVDDVLLKLRGISMSEADIERLRAAVMASASPSSSSAKNGANAVGKCGKGENSRDACGDGKDPIAYSIAPDISYAKQLYSERHEGLKVAPPPSHAHYCFPVLSPSPQSFQQFPHIFKPCPR
jgi:hypothetical protein